MKQTTEMMTLPDYFRKVLAPMVVSGTKAPLRLDINAANPVIGSAGTAILPPMLASAAHTAAAMAINEAAPAGVRWAITGLQVQFEGEVLHQCFVEADLTALRWAEDGEQIVPVLFSNGAGGLNPVSGSVTVRLTMPS